MSQKSYSILDALIIIPFITIPLFFELPFRVNIFLSWEGAYRLYLGQMPFRDFGLPMGFGYWLIPALFFNIFGPSLYTLIKAQVLINLISLVSLRGILYNLGVKPLLVTLSILVFCLTYVIFNFWPWYNHSVIVFELASLYFLTLVLTRKPKYSKLFLFISAGLAFLSFFTKQDAGAICLLLSLALLSYHSFIEKEYSTLATFVVSYLVFAGVVFFTFLPYDLLYWFNYGQPPHDSRITLEKLFGILRMDSPWEKIYLSLFVVLLVILGRKRIQELVLDKEKVMLMFICVVIILQAALTRTTSPQPADHMTYLHPFGILLLITLAPVSIPFERPAIAASIAGVVVLCFSSNYWNYALGVFDRVKSHGESSAAAPVPDKTSEKWVASGIRGFEGVLMPPQTVEGVQRILDSGMAGKPDLKVLNMSELTPLALEMGYKPLTDQPMWYHRKVGIFTREVEILCSRVVKNEYDLVLFEDIPDLTDFYPYQIRDSLRHHYTLQDRFLAPRKLENSWIEVYVKKN